MSPPKARVTLGGGSEKRPGILNDVSIVVLLIDRCLSSDEGCSEGFVINLFLRPKV